ncbi:MAG: HAMP domain-containing protein, partial [Candidatus Electrothrix sp. AR4]|nr:HAMP domain-containing protein [Candidatus Electrothrix sp. AR4]
MKATSSLFAKILAWFFLNLLLVVAVLTFFFAFQPKLNLHEIFGQQGSDRLRTAGMLIAHDLEQMSEEFWPNILARHAEIHGVDFMLVLKDGTVFSPLTEKVPETVMRSTEEILRRRGGRHGSIHWNRNAPQGELVHSPPPCESDCPLPESVTRRREFRAHEGYGWKPHLVMRTDNPTRYWFGMRIPTVTGMGHRMPGLLLAVSDSITGNGFFFDPLPWMVVAGAVILISVLLWIPLIRNITKPLGRMTLAAEEIAKGNFSVSMQEARADEI